MSHLKCITLPRKATIIIDDPASGGVQFDGEDIVMIMESLFGFVFEYIEVKGKAVS